MMKSVDQLQKQKKLRGRSVKGVNKNLGTRLFNQGFSPEMPKRKKPEKNLGFFLFFRDHSIKKRLK